MTEKEKMNENEKFLCAEFQMLSWNGAMQRASVYRKYPTENYDKKKNDERKKSREKFRECLTNKLYKQILPTYGKEMKPVSEEEHCNNIEKLAKCIESHKKILREPYHKIGTAQKLLNLQLKYLWCAGKICRPPHCPIDSRILKHVKWKCEPWTRWKCIDIYKAAIEKIRNKADGEHVADWELRTFNELK